MQSSASFLFTVATSIEYSRPSPQAPPRGTVHLHSHCATCLNMYISIVLGATLLYHITSSKAAVIPQSSNNTMSSTTTGFKNVAYFVNWVSQFTVYTPPTSYYPELSLIREFTDATTIPKICQHKSSPTFSMPLQMSAQSLVKYICQIHGRTPTSTTKATRGTMLVPTCTAVPSSFTCKRRRTVK